MPEIPEPSVAELKNAVEEWLNDRDDPSVAPSMKHLRTHLEERYGMPLAHRKALLKSTTLELLQEQSVAEPTPAPPSPKASPKKQSSAAPAGEAKKRAAPRSRLTAPAVSPKKAKTPSSPKRRAPAAKASTPKAKEKTPKATSKATPKASPAKKTTGYIIYTKRHKAAVTKELKADSSKEGAQAVQKELSKRWKALAADDPEKKSCEAESKRAAEKSTPVAGKKRARDASPATKKVTPKKSGSPKKGAAAKSSGAAKVEKVVKKAVMQAKVATAAITKKKAVAKGGRKLKPFTAKDYEKGVMLQKIDAFQDFSDDYPDLPEPTDEEIDEIVRRHEERDERVPRRTVIRQQLIDERAQKYKEEYEAKKREQKAAASAKRRRVSEPEKKSSSKKSPRKAASASPARSR